MPPQFVNPGLLATNAIQQFLMQKAMEERRRMLDEAAQQEQSDRRNQRGLLQMQQDFENQRTVEADRIAEEERQRELSEAANAKGMRQFTADAMRGGALDDRGTARALAADVYGETGQVPGILAPSLAPDTSGRDLAEYEQKAMIDASIESQQPTTPRGWQSAGSGVIFNPDTGEFRQAPGSGGRGGGEDDGGMNDYTARGQSRLLRAIDDLEPMIGPNTVGTWRAKGSRTVQAITPGEVNPTIDFDEALKQITALIGFDELNQMRQASPTGGALGQVSERELMYLQSVAGSLNPNQSEPAFRAQLKKVRDEIERVVNFGLEGNAGTGRGSGAGGGRARWGRDAQGRPVRLQ